MSTSIAHRFEFNNMSILSHPPNHLPALNSAGFRTSSTVASFGHSNSLVARRPLSSIPQVQSDHSDTSSSKSFVSLAEPHSTGSCKPSPYPRPTRRSRKLRSARTDSPSSARVPTHRSGKKLAPCGDLDDAQRQGQRLDDNDDDDDVGHEPLIPYQRLNLSLPTMTPSAPPPIPDDMVIPRSHCVYGDAPVVEPAYEIPRRETPTRDTHTCIRSAVHPHAVSISTRPPVHLSKTLTKLHRVRKSKLPSSPADHHPSCSLETKSSQERDIWWAWSRTCPITGDGNQSSHSTPLRCKDLKRRLDDMDVDSLGLGLEILSKPISRLALGSDKSHYPG